VLVVAAGDAERARARLMELGERVTVIGEVAAGTGQVRIVP
jgi:phosphoribosylaminoimidazole (AIR) synthetase